MQIEQLVQAQRDYFYTNATLDVSFRINALRKLYDAIKRHEGAICEALEADLGKARVESYMCEVGLALSEISYMMRHTVRFAAEKRVHTPLAQFPSRSFKKPSPYGVTLIMSPWNYPFLLCIEPLANAIAAGNTAIVKPSAYSPATSAIIANLLSECFAPEYVACVTGGRKENTALLEQKFDFIFFTGSTTVGKEVLRHAAEHVTPTVLELGGKSPCIVDASANLKLAAKRIVFGKFLNSGQTCVAPDYILCHESVKDQFIAEVKAQIDKQYADALNPHTEFGSIINEKHYERVLSLIDPLKVIKGGGCNDSLRRIEPTIMDNVTWDDAVMQQEIFGPLMPILTFNSYDEIFARFSQMPKPLALYIFATNSDIIHRVTGTCQFGGGCVNDTIIHLATTEMGFGGVGESGMGAYHGKTGFEAFSHTKSIVQKRQWLDLPMRYHPYNSVLFEKLIRLFLR